MKAVCIGECMIEVALHGGDAATRAYGGDTFNTAIYLARLGWEVAYATAVGGDDPFSAGLVELMRREGVSDRMTARVEGALPGLYAIEVDAAGERQFYYWRGQAPVRQLLAHLDAACLSAAASEAALVYLSGISLAVLRPPDRAGVTAILQAASSAGASLALDVNYRPALWDDPAAAADAIDALVPSCRFISFSEPEAAEIYDGDATALARRWAQLGAEVVLRRTSGEVEIFAGDGEERFRPEAQVAAVDTTGAGDAFNAAYLAARLEGRDRRAAVREARGLAAKVVLHRGAIIPREAMPHAREFRRIRG